MNWMNWVYLVVGLAVGMSIGGLRAWLKKPSDSSSITPIDQQDVSALVQQLKQTQLAYEMSKEMSQFKAGFLARTTHVLRSPLNGLIGLHQLILSNLCESPEEEREFIAQAHERALKLLKLIDEILKVARTEHGTHKLDPQPQSLAEVLREVRDITYMLAENRNFPFHVSLPDPEIYVFADPHWIRQVLVSLVENAISQMQEGRLCISAGLSSINNVAYIWLDIPTHAITQSESIDLLTSEKESALLLSGMKLLLNQTLLEVMGGKLEIVDSIETPEHKDRLGEFLSLNEEQNANLLSRLQVSIPLVIPEAEFLEMEEMSDEVGCTTPS